jgi:hypothetical protein
MKSRFIHEHRRNFRSRISVHPAAVLPRLDL